MLVNSSSPIGCPLTHAVDGTCLGKWRLSNPRVSIVPGVLEKNRIQGLVEDEVLLHRSHWIHGVDLTKVQNIRKFL